MLHMRSRHACGGAPPAQRHQVRMASGGASCRPAPGLLGHLRVLAAGRLATRAAKRLPRVHGRQSPAFRLMTVPSAGEARLSTSSREARHA